MHPYQRDILGALDRPAELHNALAGICADLCAGAQALVPSAGELSGFIARLHLQGESFLSIALADGVSTLLIHAQRSGWLCHLQLTPTLQSSERVRQQWQAHYTSAPLAAITVEQEPASRRAA